MRWRLVLLALLATACRERANVGDGPYADKVALDIPQIERAIGVKFKTPPKLEIRSRDQVRDFLLSKLREPDAVKQMANSERTYKLLGLLPDTMHLSDFFVKVLTEQVMGYYDPKTKVLYVVDGAPEVHRLRSCTAWCALQDQYVNLDSLEHVVGDDDRAAAVQAVIEGEATYEQVFIMAGGSGNLAAQLPGGWESMRATIREAQQNQPIFSSAPVIQKLCCSASTARISSDGSNRGARQVAAGQPAGFYQLCTTRRTSGSGPTCRAMSCCRPSSSWTRTISVSSGRDCSCSSIRRIRTGRFARQTDWMATATHWSKHRQATRSCGPLCGTRPAMRRNSCRQWMA
jgi:hypothetical protein